MSFSNELKRRNVFRVGAAYAVVGWLIIQVAETVFPLFGFDEAPARMVVIVLTIGFVPALVLAWAFELTPEGLRREPGFDPARPAPAASTKRLDRLIMVALALALGWLAFDRFVVVPMQSATLISEARESARTEAIVSSYGDKSIAVLPFDDMSPDGDQEYLSDGIAEELLNVLATVKDLRVISRTSSFAFKGQMLGAPEIAKRLKVAHVLEGSVRKSGPMVRITAQLIDARSDTHLWSRTWDRKLADVFALQDEIAGAVAQSLSSVLLDSNSPKPADPLTQSELDAYELVLRGRYLMHQQTGATYTRAVPLFEKAIALAPDMAAAYGAMALTLRQLVDLDQVRAEDTIERIDAALDRAFELDPDNVDALVARGKSLSETDIASARDYWLRATEVNPSEPDAWRYLAFSYQYSDSLKMLELMRKAYSVDPTRWLTNYQLMHTLSDFGQFEEALQLVRDYHTVVPDSIDPLLWYADVNYFRGRSDEALKGYYAVFRSEPDPANFSTAITVDVVASPIAWLLIGLERPDLAESWARELSRRMPGSGYSLAPLNVALSFQGKIREARQALENYTDNATNTEGFGYGNPRFSVQGSLSIREGDFEGARVVLERGLTPAGEEQPQIGWAGNADWLAWVNYVHALNGSGHTGRARELASELLAILREQRKGGVIRLNLISTGILLSALSAEIGDREQALYWLEQALDDEVVLCTMCMSGNPAFDLLRGDPRFDALVGRIRDEYAAQRDRLASEGLLLMPQEVRALEDFEYDPFDDVSRPLEDSDTE